MLEAVQATNERLSSMLVDTSKNIAGLTATVEMLKAEAEEEEEDGGEGDEAKEFSVVSSAANEIEDPQVVDPDSYAFSGLSTRKSIEWAPEMANIPQLHEFDDAPSVGEIRLVLGSGSGSGQSGGASSGGSSGSSITLKLVDPDGHTAEEDTSQKWMVPLRQADGSGKVLHWARIGNSVTFDVGSIIETPCPPPDVWLESGTGDSVTLKVRSWTKNASGDCVSGVTQYTFTPTSVDAPDCSGIRACIDDPVDVVTNVSICGTSLYVERKRVWVARHIDLTPISISGSTCEDGEGSVTA